MRRKYSKKRRKRRNGNEGWEERRMVAGRGAPSVLSHDGSVSHPLTCEADLFAAHKAAVLFGPGGLGGSDSLTAGSGGLTGTGGLADNWRTQEETFPSRFQTHRKTSVWYRPAPVSPASLPNADFSDSLISVIC